MSAFTRRIESDNRVFLVIVGVLVAMAWLGLLLWSHSPYARYLDHEQLGRGSLDERLLVLPLLIAGWTVMTVAMMLPTSLPLIALFRSMVRQRPERTRLVLLLIAGYIGIWVLFGLVAHLADWGLHQTIDRSTWLNANAWMIGSGTLLLAGAYQFTPLKYHCLDQCRSPLSFILSHWAGRNEQRQAFRLGAHHGLFCLGCCWSLMLVLFIVGMGNLTWMLLLGIVMAIEKNLSWGRLISAPLGVLLIISGLMVTAASLI